jgi:hypothetical protein
MTDYRCVTSFSLRAFAPELFHATVLNRHHRFDSVLHAELRQANAGGSIRKCRFGTDDGREITERTKEKIRKRNADRRNAYSAAPTGAAAPQA